MEKSDDKNGLVAAEVIDAEVIQTIERNVFSRNRSKVIAGILGATIFIGGGIAIVHNKPFARNQATVAAGMKVASVDPVATPTDATQIVEASTPIAYTNNMVLPDPTQNGGYRIKTEMPPGFYVYGITFHQGFRPAGLQAVDVHILARSHANEYEFVEGRDEIVSITGTSGKTYNMIGTKRTGVNTNAYSDTYQEQEITEYQDVSEKETDIVSVSIRRDGKIYTIKPDEDTKHDTTYPPKATPKTVTTTTTPKATTVSATPAKVTPTPTTTPAVVAEPKYTATNPPMPPAELTQAIYGEIYNPSNVRKLAAWVIANPAARAYYKANGNPDGATATYTNKTIIPLPPGYGTEPGHGGDYYDPDYLNAYADYQEWLVKPNK